MKKKAMIFAAGYGSRLKEITNNKPKALVEVKGKTLLEVCITKLKKNGYTDFVINVHHFSNQIIDFLKEHNNFDVNIIISDESEELLDTGGGLVKAEKHLTDADFILLHNVDIVSDIDIHAIEQFHIKHAPLASLAVQKRDSNRQFLINKDNLLCGWENKSSGEAVIARNDKEVKGVGFSGIHIISPEIFKKIQRKGKFSIRDTYLDLAKTENIMCFDHTNNYVVDAGTPENIKHLNNMIKGF